MAKNKNKSKDKDNKITLPKITIQDTRAAADKALRIEKPTKEEKKAIEKSYGEKKKTVPKDATALGKGPVSSVGSVSDLVKNDLKRQSSIVPDRNSAVDNVKLVGAVQKAQEEARKATRSPYEGMSYRQMTDDIHNTYGGELRRGNIGQFDYYIDRGKYDRERIEKASRSELLEMLEEKETEYNYLFGISANPEERRTTGDGRSYRQLAGDRVKELDVLTDEIKGRISSIDENDRLDREYEVSLMDFGKKALSAKGDGKYVPTESKITEYDYINRYHNGELNDDALRALQKDHNNWTELTKGEVKLFNDLYEIDPDEAFSFVKNIEGTLKKRLAEYQSQKAYEYGQEHPYLGGAKSVMQNVTTGAIAAADNLIEGITGDVDTYDASSRVLRESQALRQGGNEYFIRKYGEKNGKKVSFAYNTGLSIVENLANIAMFKGAGKLASGLIATNMASNAAANSMINIDDRGGNDFQILVGGVASGAAEYLFEKYSVEKFFDIKSTKGIVNTVKAIGTQAGIESSEEIFTEAANIISDAVIMQQNSESNQRLREYVMQGMNYDEASKKVFHENIEQVAEAGLAGLLSGVVMGGGAVIMNNASRAGYLKNKGEQMINSPSTMNRILQYGIEQGNSDARYTAELLGEGGRIDGKAAGKLLESVLSTSIEKDGGMVNIIRAIDALEGKGNGYMGSKESIDTARAVMHTAQGQATDVDRALIGRSGGAITLLTAIEGNEKALESVRKAAGKQLRASASIEGSDNPSGSASHLPLHKGGYGRSAAEGAADGVRYRYTGKTKSGIKKYVTDFPADMDYKTREKVFKERIATVFNLGAVKLNTDIKKIQVMGDKFTGLKNIHGDIKATDSEMHAKVNSLYDIAEILNDSQYVGKDIEESYKDSSVAPKNQAHKGVKYWYKFKNTISMDGEIYDVIFNIRDKGKEQYQYLIDFHKKGDDSNQPYGRKDLLLAIDESSPTDRIPQNAESVNAYSMRDGEIYSQGKRVLFEGSDNPSGSASHLPLHKGGYGKGSYIVLDDESLSFRRKNPKGYKIIATMAKDLGMRVKFVKGLTDGTGKALDGVITSEGIFINSEAENPSQFAATHEFSHRMKQTAPEAWKRYQDFVISRLKVDGRYYKVFDKKAAAYGTENESYIDEEITADYIGELFGNEAELADFIRESRRDAVTIRDVWYSILDKLDLLDEKKKALSLWRNAYKEAVLNRDVEYEGEKSSQMRGENNPQAYDEKTNQFTVDENVVKAFQNKVDAWKSGTVKGSEYFELGKTPVVMRSLGVTNLPVAFDLEVMWKMTGGKHGINTDDIKNLPVAINNPLMILESSSRENAYVLVLPIVDKSGDTAVAAIHLNRHLNRLLINKVTSVYGKENIESFIEREIAKGKLKYYDKIKSQQWSTSRGLQLPKLVQSITDNNIILQKEDVVNTYSMQNDGNYPKKSVSGTRLSDIEAENAELRKQLENVRLFNVSKSAQYGAEVRRAAQDMKSGYGSKINLSVLQRELNELYNYMIGKDVRNDAEVLSRAHNLAERVIAQATETVINEESGDLLERITAARIRVPESERADFRDGYEYFRKHNAMGKITLTNDGIDLDVLWNELCNEYPQYFDENIIGSEERLERILDIREEILPTEESIYKTETEKRDAVRGLESDIIEGFYNIPKSDGGNKYTFYGNNAPMANKAREESKDRAASKKISWNKSEVKKKIDSDYNYLSRMVKDPTDARHIPEDMRASVAYLMDCFNFETKQLERIKDEGKEADSPTAVKLSKMYDAYADIMRKAWGISPGNTETELLDQHLSADLQELRNEIPLNESGEFKRIQDMSIDELRSVAKVLTSVHHIITQRNKAFNSAVKEEISELGQNAKEDMKSIRNKRKGSGEKLDYETTKIKKAIKMADEYFNIDNLQPWDFFHGIGGIIERLYMEERKAFDKHIENIREASNLLKEATKMLDLKKLTGKHAEKAWYKLQSGDEIRISKGQILSLYALYSRKQGKEHILEGGIVTNAEAKNLQGQKTSPNSAHHITEADLGKMFEKISEQEKEMVRKVVEFLSKRCAKWGNETSMRLYGYDKFGEGWYFPIKVSKQTLNTYYGEHGEGNIRSQSFTKQLVKNARNAIEVGDFFDIVTSHINGMSLYNTVALPMLDMERVLNFAQSSADAKVREDIIRTYGKSAEKYIATFHKDVNGSRKTTDKDSILEKLSSNAKRASIGMNVRVFLQQPTSIARALLFLNPLDFRSMHTGITLHKEMLDNIPIAYWKSVGFRDIGTGNTIKEVLLDNESLYSKASMGMYGMADDFTWAWIYGTVKNEIKRKNPEIDTNSELFKTKVRERFNYIVDRSQVVDSIFHRTETMRSGNIYTKNATMFMSEPLKTYNMYRTEMLDAVKNGEVGRKTARATAVFVVSNLLLSIAQALPDTWREDGEEELFNKDGKRIPLWERFFKNIGENMIDNSNPMTYLPYIKDIWSMIQGYSQNRVEYSNLSLLVNAVFKGLKDDKKSNVIKFINVARPASAVFGLSYGNLYRDAKAIYDTVYRMVGDEYADYMLDKFSWDVKNPDNKSKFMKHYKRALQNGHSDDAATILSDYMAETFEGKNFEHPHAEKVISEMSKLYGKTDEDSKLFYDLPDKEFSFDKKEYTISESDYPEYVDGAYQKLFDLAYEMVSDKRYKDLSDEDKVRSFGEIRSFAEKSQRMEDIDGYELAGWEKAVYDGETDYMDSVFERIEDREYQASRDKYKDNFDYDSADYSPEELGVIEKVESDAATYYASLEKDREYNEKTLRHIAVYDEKLSDEMSIEEYAGIRAYAKKTAAMADGKESMKKNELKAYLDSTDYSRAVKRALFEAIGNSNWKNPY